MNKLNILNYLYAAVVLTLTALAIPAQAHELRYLGHDYWIQLGGHVEPPYTNVKNGIDVFVFHNDFPKKPFPDGLVGLDPSKGDTVHLEAFGLVTKTASFNAPITNLFPLVTPWKQTEFEGFPLFYQENAFVFKKPTPYGFYAQGKLQRKGFGPLKFAQKFICERGSRDVTYGTAFECIMDPMPPAAAKKPSSKGRKMLLGDLSK